MTTGEAVALGVSGAATGASAIIAQVGQAVTPDSLASKGAPYILAVAVLALAYVVVRLFNRLMNQSEQERSDLKTIVAENSKALDRVGAVLKGCELRQAGESVKQ